MDSYFFFCGVALIKAKLTSYKVFWEVGIFFSYCPEEFNERLR